MPSEDFKSISAKISRQEFTLVDGYCDKKGITPSSLIRELLMREIEIAVPHNVAGKNMIKYDKEKDNFSWSITLDDNTLIEIIKNVPAEYFQQLQDEINDALNSRTVSIKKTKKDSIAIPSNLTRRKK